MIRGVGRDADHIAGQIAGQARTRRAAAEPLAA
jgi:hypothetical protein